MCTRVVDWEDNQTQSSTTRNYWELSDWWHDLKTIVFKLNSPEGQVMSIARPWNIIKTLSNFSMSYISFHSTWYFCSSFNCQYTHTPTVKYWTSLTLISLEGSNFNQIIITQAVVFCDLRIQTKTLRESASLWRCTNQIQALFSFIQNPPIVSCMCVIFCSVQ